MQIMNMQLRTESSVCLKVTVVNYVQLLQCGHTIQLITKGIVAPLSALSL